MSEYQYYEFLAVDRPLDTKALTAVPAGKAFDGHAYITGIREKYSRHTAFRSELDTAVSTSTLTSSQWPGPAAGARTAQRPGRRPR